MGDPGRPARVEPHAPFSSHTKFRTHTTDDGAHGRAHARIATAVDAFVARLGASARNTVGEGTWMTEQFRPPGGREPGMVCRFMWRSFRRCDVEPGTHTRRS